MAKKRKRRSGKKVGKYCVMKGGKRVSCHRKKRVATKMARRKGGRVVGG